MRDFSLRHAKPLQIRDYLYNSTIESNVPYRVQDKIVLAQVAQLLRGV
jgi:hypothetical protein